MCTSFEISLIILNILKITEKVEKMQERANSKYVYDP
jgi:hypothetical protein